MSLLDRISTVVGSPEDLERLKDSRKLLGEEVSPSDNRVTIRAKGAVKSALENMNIEGKIEGNVILTPEQSQELSERAEEAHETGEIPVVTLPENK